MTDAMGRSFVAIPINPGNPLEVAFALHADNLSFVMNSNSRIFGDTLD
jgi:hypothetical protein